MLFARSIKVICLWEHLVMLDYFTQGKYLPQAPCFWGKSREEGALKVVGVRFSRYLSPLSRD